MRIFYNLFLLKFNISKHDWLHETFNKSQLKKTEEK